MRRREVELQSSRCLDLRVTMELRPIVRDDRLAATSGDYPMWTKVTGWMLTPITGASKTVEF